MLTHEIMGLLVLGILWVNTALVTLAAFTPLGQLWASLGRTWRRGEVATGDGDGVLAEHVIEQVGRRASDDGARQAILFHDRDYRSVVHGGTITFGDDTLAIDDADGLEVWVATSEKKARAEAPNDDFDAAYRQSRRAKGFVRELRSPIAQGQTVYVGDASNEPRVLADYDPRPWLKARIAMVIGFQIAMVGVSAFVTWLALYPPLFGTVSTIGGLLGLVHFLLVMQPLGVTVREAALLPQRAIVRGAWVKAGSEGTGVSADVEHAA